MLHGRIIRDQRKFPEAAEEFERATKLKPDAPQAWSELAGCAGDGRKLSARAGGAGPRGGAARRESPATFSCVPSSWIKCGI